MTYKDYEGFTKTYVVVYVTGTGVMEDNFIDHDVVFETDNKDEAESKANELKIRNNSPADIESTWYSNRYHVNINTLSKMGKKLLEKFQSDFDERLQKGLKEGRYDEVKVDREDWEKLHDRLEAFCACGNPSKEGFVNMEEDGETLSYYCCDCRKKRKTK